MILAERNSTVAPTAKYLFCRVILFYESLLLVQMWGLHKSLPMMMLSYSFGPDQKPATTIVSKEAAPRSDTANNRSSTSPALAVVDKEDTAAIAMNASSSAGMDADLNSEIIDTATLVPATNLFQPLPRTES